ncbi:TPA: group II intron reverse transcriptase/maturase, partial [Clostridioides difficile]|nr:group II intron reverse transcriptase/maturase [Clostridioides difficile]
TKARYTPEYTKLVGLRQRLHNKIKNSNGIEREKLIEEYKTATAKMLKLPAKQCDDKKIKYVRYADDFLIAVNGNR